MQPSRKPGKRGKRTQWGPLTTEADWTPGSLHQLQPEPNTPGGGKRSKHGWQPKVQSMQDIFHSNKHRVEACWEQSLGVKVCQQLGEQLHQAMQNAPIEDHRLSVAGEKHRILTRALAMREVLMVQDPTLQAKQVPEQLGANNNPQLLDTQGRVVTMHRSSNEADPDATAEQCCLSVCLLLAALYEQTPYGEGSELRRQVYHDFTLLKRNFRQDDLTILHGKTGTIKELFETVKDLDKTQGLENMIGLCFQDWKVHKRVDSFILAEQLDVQVLTLTSDGPIGKFMCKLRTLMTLCLLQQRLLKELYTAVFAGRQPPMKQFEMMTATDELDFIDFTEAMARNVPHKHVDGSELFYAWIYSPEVHATPEQWATIFGPGANTLPTLYDGVTTPDGAVCMTGPDGDYNLDVNKAAQHDYFNTGSAQSAVGFSWADDLIGAYLRKVRQNPVQVKQPAPETTATPAAATNTDGATATTDPAPDGSAATIKTEPAPGADGAAQQQQQVTRGGGIARTAPPARHIDPSQIELTLSSQQTWALSPREGTKWHQAGGPVSSCAPCVKREVPVLPIANANETGLLALPLGIFMVGLICSGTFTNTQIHVEDLLLMSININIFGAPKIWWWLPQAKVQGFKEAAELMTEGGRGELYTKSISPFLTDREFKNPEHVLPLDRLKELGAKRTVQLPGMGIWTMPGYAFHFTVSMGLNVAESCNMFLEVMGWTLEKLWMARPKEQYPEAEDDMSRYMRETGLLGALGLPDRPPRDAAEVHRELAPRFVTGAGKGRDRQQVKRQVYSNLVKYCSLGMSSGESDQTQSLDMHQQEQGSTDVMEEDGQEPHSTGLTPAPLPFIQPEAVPDLIRSLSVSLGAAAMHAMEVA